MTKEEEREIREKIAMEFHIPPHLVDKIDISKAVNYLFYLRSDEAKVEKILNDMEDNRE